MEPSSGELQLSTVQLIATTLGTPEHVRFDQREHARTRGAETPYDFDTLGSCLRFHSRT